MQCEMETSEGEPADIPTETWQPSRASIRSIEQSREHGLSDQAAWSVEFEGPCDIELETDTTESVHYDDSMTSMSAEFSRPTLSPPATPVVNRHVSRLDAVLQVTWEICPPAMLQWGLADGEQREKV